MADLLGGILGGGLGLIGSLLGSGSKVKIPAFQPVNADKVQSDAIAGNIANFDQAQKLTSRLNDSNFEELHNYLTRAIPGYQDIIKGQSDVIQKGLKGEIPDDVAKAIEQRSASRAVAGGFSGSGMARNLTSRDLGLTSYDITNKALTDASRFVTSMKSTAVPDLTSPASMFLSPSQRLNAAIGQNTEAYNSQVMSAQANAAPDPMLSSLGSFAGGLGGIMFRGSLSGYGSGGTGYGNMYPPSNFSLLDGGNSIYGNTSFSRWKP